MSINDRIKILIDKLANGKQNVFAEATSIKSTTINGIVGPRQSEPSFSTLKKIIDSYPSLNINWLMKEEGKPLIDQLTEEETFSETELKIQYKDALEKIRSSTFLSGNLRQLRKHIQITQDAFGKIFGVTRDKIASYERGTKPKLSFLIDIENYFHISLEELISYNLKEHPKLLEKVSILNEKDKKHKKISSD